MGYSTSQKNAYTTGFNAFNMDYEESNPYSQNEEEDLHELWEPGYNDARDELRDEMYR